MALPDHPWKAEPLADVCRLPDVIGLVERQEGDETAQRPVGGRKLEGRGALERLRVLPRERRAHTPRDLSHAALDLGERRALRPVDRLRAASERGKPRQPEAAAR